MSNSTPRFKVLFCDDVRREIGGKVTIVGVYQGALGIPQPETIGRLIALLFVDIPKSFGGKDIYLQVFDREQELVSGTINLPTKEAEPDNTNGLPSSQDRIYITLPIEIKDIPLKSGMSLQVKARCEDFYWESENLTIVSANQQ